MGLIHIHNQYLTDVNWAGASQCDFVLNNTIDIWRINISVNLEQLDNFMALMPPDELERAKRYYHQRDRQRFTVSRGAQRIILSNYLHMPPASIVFERGHNKKPFIKNAKGVAPYYNISHAGNWIVLGVSDSTIGIDTEFADPSFDYKGVIGEYFNKDEMAFIDNDPLRERFFVLWTRKEALTKATAKGLDDDLKFIPGLDGEHAIDSRLMASSDDWNVTTFKLDNLNLATAASNLMTGSKRFWDIDFPQ